MYIYMYMYMQVQHILASTSPSGRSIVWDLRKNEPIIQVKCIMCTYTQQHTNWAGLRGGPHLSILRMHIMYTCILIAMPYMGW